MFIINPKSGVFKKKRIPKRIRKFLNHRIFYYEIKYTEYAGHATLLAYRAVQRDFDMVIACGGDGSINEIANSLVHTKTALGIIALGSGNGIARHLKISRNVRKAIETINTFNVQTIDAAKVNNRYFFSNAGYGFAGVVVQQFSKQQLRGLLSYAWAITVQFYSRFRPQKFKIRIDDAEIEREIFELSNFNSNQFGFELGFAKNADLQDGLLNVFLLNKFPRWKMYYVVLLSVLSKYDKIREGEIYMAKSVRIFNPDRKILAYQFDGESEETEGDLNFEIVPGALKVVAPNLN